MRTLLAGLSSRSACSDFGGACAGTPLASRTSLDRHPGIPQKGSVPAYGVGLHSPIRSEVEVLSSLPLPLPEMRAQVVAWFAFACLAVPLGILLPPVAPNPCLHPRRVLPLPLFGQSSVSRCSAERRGDALAPVPGVVAPPLAGSSSHPSLRVSALSRWGGVSWPASSMKSLRKETLSEMLVSAQWKAIPYLYRGRATPSLTALLTLS